MIHIFTNTNVALGRVRIAKLTRLLNDNGIDFAIHKYGSDASSTKDQEERRISPLFSDPWVQIPRNLQYIFWFFRLYFRALRMDKNTPIYALGLDSALPLTLGGQRFVVFDNADNFYMSKSWPRVLRTLFTYLERKCASRCFMQIIPGQERILARSKCDVILPNTPTRSVLDQAKTLSNRTHLTRELLTVYVNGWLVDTRGIDTLVKALSEANHPEQWMRVIVAGRLGGAASQQLIKFSCVDYRGQVSNAEALALYYQADITFTAYDPKIEINRLAEPNKWGDCLATNTPFICNKEIVTARPFVNANACVTFSYSAHKELLSTLWELSQDRRLISNLKEGLKEIKWRFWDEEVSDVIQKLLSASGATQKHHEQA